MIDVYTYYLSHMLNYRDDLEAMSVDEFTQKLHLFSPQILGLFPSLMAFTQKDGKVYKEGCLKRIKTKYSCKKYANNEAIQKRYVLVAMREICNIMVKYIELLISGY
eukprot:148707_1